MLPDPFSYWAGWRRSVHVSFLHWAQTLSIGNAFACTCHMKMGRLQLPAICQLSGCFSHPCMDRAHRMGPDISPGFNLPSCQVPAIIFLSSFYLSIYCCSPFMKRILDSLEAPYLSQFHFGYPRNKPINMTPSSPGHPPGGFSISPL
jgi:hypothetical protein